MSPSLMPFSTARSRALPMACSTASPGRCAAKRFKAMTGPAGLGEFGRIRECFAPLAGPGSLDLTDDAALLDCPPGYHLVVTVDQAVEGVHFLPGDPPEAVAKKLMRRNLSDLAAMGATPRHYL